MNARQGTSTIDYAICNVALYKCIENFIVLPLTEISDHSKIVTVLKNSISLQNNPIDNYNWQKLKTRFKWDNNKNREFFNILKSSTAEIEDINQ